MELIFRSDNSPHVIFSPAKTTITSLLQKLYLPTSGRITIGHYDLNYVTLESLRQRVGAVPQKLDLFGGNVIENIALGDMSPDMQRISDVCRSLGLDELIKELPEGFSTHLGERGANLSGGQQQRIAIARALYLDPEILILDEATSHLDTKSETEVNTCLDDFRKRGKTIIVIAHRLSTVVNADQILVMGTDGSLVEQGTFKTLLEYEGEFYELWKRQTQTVS